VEAPPTSQSIGSCTSIAHSSSVAVVREYFSSVREENNSSTCSEYYLRSLTTSRVRGAIARATPGSLFGHQATACLWRLLIGGPTSQQRVGHQQGHHGRVRCGDMQAQEQVFMSGNPSCDSRQQCGGRCAIKTRFWSS
jgi:hypothetical protein